MKLILSAGSLHHLPLPEVFPLARDTGFAGVEVIINHEFAFHDGVELLGKLQRILPIQSLHAPFFQVDGWGDKIEQLHRTIRLAAALKVPLVTFHPPAWCGFEFKFWNWMKRTADFQAEVGQGKVQVTLENMPYDSNLKLNPYRLAKTPRLIEFLQAHNLLLTFDTAHMGSMKTNFLHDFHLLYETGRMQNIHFSDYGHGREHLLPGRGSLPLTRFLNHLRETNYDEALVLELSPEEFPPGRDNIIACLAQLYDYLAAETSYPRQPERLARQGHPGISS
jgi:sugar phosphate isomerase/epimerase